MILIGTDLPNLKREDIEKAISLLDDHHICVGPSTDGGFYLFASKLNIAKDIWKGVPYSSEHTLNSLLERFSTDVKISYLEAKTDVDELDDLLKLYTNISGEQNKALSKISKLVSENILNK